MNNKLRLMREKKKLKQYQLASKVGTYSSFISIIESHGYIPNEDMKKKLARALGCKVSALWPE